MADGADGLAGPAGAAISAQARDQLRALIIEELEHLIRG